MTLPNFVIIGAFRSGTTSLYYCLRQHPQIFMSPIKETNFLAYKGEADTHDKWNRFRVTSFAEYETLFSAAADARAVGEASPLYLVRSVAAERISQYMADAKLIAMLRNLVRSALPPTVRQELIDVYRDDIVKLQDLIKRDLSHWLKPVK